MLRIVPIIVSRVDIDRLAFEEYLNNAYPSIADISIDIRSFRTLTILNEVSQ